MSWRAEKPFNELPLLPLAAQVMETTEILKACIGARAALAELSNSQRRLATVVALYPQGHRRSLTLDLSKNRSDSQSDG